MKTTPSDVLSRLKTNGFARMTDGVRPVSRIWNVKAVVELLFGVVVAMHFTSHSVSSVHVPIAAQTAGIRSLK